MGALNRGKLLSQAECRSLLLLFAVTACGGADWSHERAEGASGAAGAAVVAGTGGGDAGGGGGSRGTCQAPGARFVTGVVSHAFGPGQNVGQDRFPDPIFGPPHGLGCCQGNTDDVVSLGNGGTVTLEFGTNIIVDEPGPDFIVFENAFWIDGNPDTVFAELATVEVSADGVEWLQFPCTAVAPPYDSCAGWHPVYANPDTNSLDPLDPNEAGGDAFDLALLGLPQAQFVRITDREDLTGLAGVFDLDAVGIVHALCP